jgi:tRNA(Ile)-lysidine synthase
VGPHPAVAELRNAVRRSLDDLEPGELVLAACSGGADSLALAAALAFVAPRLGLRAGSITVDHRLQPGSARQADQVAAVATGLGLDPVHVVAVTVGDRGGPEAAARAARYQALDEIRKRAGAAVVLLGHTRDDQAETVLLGLARGSGTRSLAGMAERSGPYRRPLLGTGRASTRAACTALGLRPWEDPHNADSGYARARVRHHALPALEATLGPGIAESLARTARQLRCDADALDELAAEAIRQLTAPDPVAGRGPASGLDTAGLARLPAAVRTRVLRRVAVQAGCPPGAIAARHVEMLDGLVTGWHGQRWVDLPGGVRGVRECGKLRLVAGGQPEDERPQTREPEGADGRERPGGGPQGGADPPAAAAGADHRTGRAD